MTFVAIGASRVNVLNIVYYNLRFFPLCWKYAREIASQTKLDHSFKISAKKCQHIKSDSVASDLGSLNWESTILIHVWTLRFTVCKKIRNHCWFKLSIRKNNVSKFKEMLLYENSEQC